MNPYPVDPLHVPEVPPLPSRKRPYLAMAVGVVVVGIVVAVWWWLS
jgi:Mg2+ and Co2+ transporter CorA